MGLGTKSGGGGGGGGGGGERRRVCEGMAVINMRH